jgi:hypothetical protein
MNNDHRYHLGDFASDRQFRGLATYHRVGSAPDIILYTFFNREIRALPSTIVNCRGTFMTCPWSLIDRREDSFLK